MLAKWINQGQCPSSDQVSLGLKEIDPFMQTATLRIWPGLFTSRTRRIFILSICLCSFQQSSIYTHSSWQEKYLKCHPGGGLDGKIPPLFLDFLTAAPDWFPWFSLCLSAFLNACFGFHSLTSVFSLVFWCMPWFQPPLCHATFYALQLHNPWPSVKRIPFLGPRSSLKGSIQVLFSSCWLPPKREKRSIRNLNPYCGASVNILTLLVTWIRYYE